MGKIKQLSKETINLISAGEVIENPSDILKELLENSIDAKATEITVDVKDAGISLLQVTDNGFGVERDDLLFCLEKYTTSKLESIDDLLTINSFGFRGEALSSINAVSKLKITSSVDDSGKAYFVENLDVKETSFKKGTKIEIRDLFYNLPVRKKYLKSNSVEFSKLYDIFLANVFLNPQITFKFNSEKKKVIFPKTNYENRLLQVFGTDIKSKGIFIDISNDFFKLKGVISNPSNQIYFPTNFLFINKRFVYSPQIYKIITEAYKDYLMIQQKPFFILFFEIDSRTVDVNVHPKKRVVKLLNEMLFLSELKKELNIILEKNLGKSTPQINSLNDYFKMDNPSNKFEYDKNKALSNTNFSRNTKYTVNDYYKPTQSIFNSETTDREELPTLFEHKITRFVGQLHNTYIVCETKEGVLFIDQHAADERINLEKNRQKVTFEKQNLISELPLPYLSEAHKDILLNNKLKLNELGFNYVYKDNKFYLTTLALFLDKYLDKNMFINILEDIKESTNTVDKLKDNLLKLKSCKQSIKANQELTLPEQIQLIKKLNLCKDKGICAHGRPTIIYFSKSELEKLFKRIV
ncbi:MAG: DNA mismatch repair endonuclease MutL [archaeon]|jgi:DNA mismatch repair protein MutL|nr:DNA mismatch repair endonuclease MutL [archaeon]MDD2477772.1 DNA mismatch repair endonuclease MutL [Candidatus ainarchaeum sp.]MDD3084856.1 DNA mismatch repair endonuclease MutL [Candidatus ainarchaeum sp.]MDD4221190.1 DNA mismatch repair endonuclease MutL [Candidatus ainarchaeum sp.]